MSSAGDNTPARSMGSDAAPVSPPACASLIQTANWANSPLGAPGNWSTALRTTVGLILPAQAQIVLFWGPEYVALYNDAYAPTIGDKHPRAFGCPARENWAELWDDLEPLLRGVRETGNTFHAKDRPFYIERKGYGETVYFDVSYSAVPEADGTTGGVLCIVSETTERVLAERRQAVLLALEEQLRAVDHLDLPRRAVELLGRHLGAHRVGYGEVQADDRTIVLHSCYANGVPPLYGAYSLDGFGPQAIAAQRHGLTQWSSDISQDPEQDPAVWDAIETRAYLSVPLVRDGRFAASLYVNYRDPHVWTKEEVTLVQEVASRTWASVARARAEAALRESESRLNLALESARLGTWDWDLVTLRGSWSARTRQIFGLSAMGELTPEQRNETIFPDDRAKVWNDLADAIDNGEEIVSEYRIVRPGGEIRWISSRGAVVRDASGKAVRATGVVLDITDKKKAEEHQVLLVNELNHRAKNLLTIIQGVAQQTFSRSAVPAEVRHTFEGRLAALAAAHDLLTQRKWESASLRHIMSNAVMAVCPAPERVLLNGPDLTLAPKTAISLAMAAHELATNALKYGSLSVSSGTVHVDWSTENNQLKLTWREAGGPVVAAPSTRGFGTRMVERGLAAELQGTVKLAFEPEGVVCTLDAPLVDRPVS